jgi:hypothetical protein
MLAGPWLLSYWLLTLATLAPASDEATFVAPTGRNSARSSVTATTGTVAVATLVMPSGLVPCMATRYAPGAAKVLTGLVASLVVPSPNRHAQAECPASNVEVSRKTAPSPAPGVPGDHSNEALRTAWSSVNVRLPVAFVAVSVTG